MNGLVAEVRKDADRERYEAFSAVGDVIGVLEYETHDGLIVLTHTRVPAELAGQGIASDLVRAGLDDIRQSGAQIVVFCSYIRLWLEKHPEYKDLLHRKTD